MTDRRTSKWLCNFTNGLQVLTCTIHWLKTPRWSEDVKITVSDIVTARLFLNSWETPEVWSQLAERFSRSQPLTGTTREVTPLASPVSTRPKYSIQMLCAEMMMVKPKMKGMEHIIKLSFRPILSTNQPPITPPRAAPRVTTDWGTEEGKLVVLSPFHVCDF